MPPEPSADVWEGSSPDELALYWGVPTVHIYGSVGSTNDVARRLAAQGVPAATIVIAEEQRAGRGRGARSWSSPPGLGFWGSFVARDLDPSGMGLLPIRVALAVATALDRWAGKRLTVKWPNDLLIESRKLGGILCEAAWDGHRLDHVIIGVGLNLLQSPSEFPETIRETATSLRSSGGESVSRFEVASAVVAALRPLLSGIPPESTGTVVEMFSKRDALGGRVVEVRDVETDRVIRTGTARGIEPTGELLVLTMEGLQPIRSGTVRIRGG